jgi:hypothetical protein
MKTAVRAFLALAFLASPMHAKDLTLRAGELLLCTLQEPNFSAATAQVGEPTVCYLGQLREFGHAAFPRGSYLTGRLADYRDPGRSWAPHRQRLARPAIRPPHLAGYRDSRLHAGSFCPRLQGGCRRPHRGARAFHPRRHPLGYPHSLAGRSSAPARAGAAPGAPGRGADHPAAAG